MNIVSNYIFCPYPFVPLAIVFNLAILNNGRAHNILTTNIAGLVAGGNVSELWQNHRTLAIEVAEDVLALQAWLTAETLDSKALIAAMLVAFEGDPEHGCTGRSAPARLQRALQIADEADLDVPTLHRIQAEQ